MKKSALRIIKYELFFVCNSFLLPAEKLRHQFSEFYYLTDPYEKLTVYGEKHPAKIRHNEILF